MSDIVIAAATRTPIGRFLGGLKDVPVRDLGAVAVSGALRHAGVPPQDVDLVVLGNARPAGCGPNLARQVAMSAGCPTTTVAWTVNMACGSGLQALLECARAVRLGEARVAVAGGAENMSRVPHLLEELRSGYPRGHARVTDAMYKDGFLCPLCGMIMGETAEELATLYSISRAEQDEYALETQRRCQQALAEGWFDGEIVPVERADGQPPLTQDEHPRADVTLEGLARLSPVFRSGGSVTAGNSSGLTDAAAALVVTSPEEARRRGLPTLARLTDWTMAGVEPRTMGIGPVPAVRALLERSGETLDSFDLVELNEAFAVQVLACDRELSLPRDRLNVAGGAIALGHPIGATGARIATTLLHQLRRTGGRRGLATLCISGGLGLAAAFTLPDGDGE